MLQQPTIEKLKTLHLHAMADAWSAHRLSFGGWRLCARRGGWCVLRRRLFGRAAERTDNPSSCGGIGLTWGLGLAPPGGINLSSASAGARAPSLTLLER